MDVTPYFDRGRDPTVRAASAVTGGRFVAVVGAPTFDQTGEGALYPSVGHQAATRQLGVAAQDAAAAAAVKVFTVGHIVPVEAGGAITAGAQVEAAADGRAVTLATGIAAGHALQGAGAAGDVIMVKVL